MTQTILVTGATGQQGTTLINTLLSTSHPHNLFPTIHGLTRDPTSSAAQSLQRNHPTLTLFPGSFDDIPALTAAAEHCTSAFINVSPVFTDPTAESRHARNLIKVCAESPTIKRVVLSSTSAMHTPRLEQVFSEYAPNNPKSWMVGYMTSKKKCEDAVTSAESAFEERWSVLRGAMFYSNFVKPSTEFMCPDLASKQSITTASRPDYKLSLVDPVDIGVVAAEMLTCDRVQWEKQWKGRSVPLAKENITFDTLVGKMNETLVKRGVNKEIKVAYIGEEEAQGRIEKGDFVMGTQVYSNFYLPPLDLEEVKSFGVDIEKMVGTQEFFDREGAKVAETVGGV